MLADLLTRRSADHPTPKARDMRRVDRTSLSFRRISYCFEGESYSTSTAGIAALSLVVGVIGGAYGIGGGSIIAPFLVSVFGLPVHTVAGAALMGTFVTSLAAVASYQLIAPLAPGMAVGPDWLLGILFGIGGLAGTYLGARTQRFMPARAIKCILMLCIFFVVGRYLIEAMR
jgi:uncharacterized membrane protein YfcA